MISTAFRTVLGTVVGVIRGVVILVTILAFASLILASSPVKRRFRDATIAAWLTSAACRVGIAILGVKVTGDDLDAIRRHDGLLFANHVSWIDIGVLLSIAPVRFLSATEIRKLPIIGAVAAAIGTVFVDRGSDESRARARVQVAEAPKRPPLVIFPEGAVPDVPGLLPFRFGAFELATAGSVAILPTVLVYDRPEAVHWGAEKLPASMWKAFTDTVHMTVRVEVMTAVATAPNDDAAVLAATMHRSMAARLGLREAM